MAFNQLNCASNFGNTGVPLCYEDFGLDRKLILVPPGSEFATSAEPIVLANWTTNINATTSDRWYPYPANVDIEDNSEDDVFEESALSTDFVKDGKKRLRYKLEAIPLGLHQQLRTHNSGKWSCFIATDEGYIKGRTVAGTKFESIPCTLLHVEKQTSVTGDALQRTYVVLEFDASDWDDRGAWVKPTAFDPVSDLNGILDVEVYEVTSLTTDITFGVKGLYDSQEITGLGYADLVLDATLASEDDGTITDNSDGTYTLTATAPPFTTGARTITLANQPSMTTKGYEASNTLSITVA